MIAAIYARKSTEQSGVADDAKSVTRQIEHAQAYAASKGWTVAEDHLYIDDGVSGAEFANRPGFVRLMNSLKPVADFDVLVMSEESRLGRESIETAYALKQLISAGVRVFFYLEDRERTLNGPMEKAMLALQTMADEMEREKARQRVHDCMIRKARAGHVTGGRLFGYKNVSETIPGPDGAPRRLYVRREIDATEAAVVRRIFELYAAGHGQRGIAKLLNEDRAPTPRPQQGRPSGWAASSVREVLFRDLYRGVQVWNKTRKRDLWGRVSQHARPETEWISVDVPELRIVSDALWLAARARFEARRALDTDRPAGDPAARLSPGGNVKYLLSKLARCGVCGGGIAVRSRSHGKGRQYRYGCHCNWSRGRRVCANALEVLMATADDAVLGVLESDLLRPAVMEQSLELALAELGADTDDGTRARALDDAIAVCDRESANLAAAVAAGGNVPALLAALQSHHARRGELAESRRQLQSMPAVDVADLRRRVRAKLTDWRSLLRGDRPGARRLLETVLDGRILFIPEDNGYRVRVPLALDRVFDGLLPFCLASPPGFEPGSRP